MEEVILVNEQDDAIGRAEKIEAHKNGLLHRAFSVFVFNDHGELLLQQRAQHKYHSPGLWTNTCCSHPRPNEITIEAARRRCLEEMGIVITLKEIFSFVYKADFENGLTEHEYDHVYVGTYNQDPYINKDEVNNFKWASTSNIKKDLLANPNHYTAWFKLCFERVVEYNYKYL